MSSCVRPMKYPAPLAALATLLTVFTSHAAPLPRSTPEAEGLSSRALLTLVEQAESRVDALHSLMVVRNGRVVAEGWWAPYQANEPHVMFSLSKSFTSTAIGLAQAEGKLSINDLVTSYFPEDLPATPSENLRGMRVRDLLMMSTGQHPEDVDRVDYFGETSAARQFLALPVPHKPGTLFYYNTPATFMLSAIVSKATGQDLVEYLTPRLFQPLGIEGARWDRDPRGVPLGGFGLNIRTEDIARFGLLYLQRGEYDGKRILPAEWVDLATSRQASNGSSPDSDWDQGYGFQFWRSRHGYRGDGAFGQFCIILPDQKTVVAITSGTGDMGGVMKLLWEKLIPELRPAALPADDAGLAALQSKLTSLRLATPAGKPTSPAAVALSGRTFRLAQNPLGLETVTFSEKNGQMTLQVRTGGRDYPIALGHGTWADGSQLPRPQTDGKLAAAGAWTAEDTYTAKLVYRTSPFIDTLLLRFTGNTLALTVKPNVAFGPNAPVEITGTAGE